MNAASNRILIRGGYILGTGSLDRPPVMDILIEGRTIVAMAPEIAVSAAEARAVDARSKLVVPGFVNAHAHLHDCFAKGLLEGQPLETWTIYSNPQNYPERTLEEVRARTLLGAAECLANGITTIQDMSMVYPMSDAYVDAILDAYADIGIRVVFAIALFDLPALETIPFLKEQLPAEAKERVARRDQRQGSLLDFARRQMVRRPANDRLTWALAPSGPQRCSPELLRAVAAMAEELDLPVLTHLYETRAQALQARLAHAEHGGSLVRLLDSVGLLTPRLTVAHGIWLADEEIEALARAGVGIVANPLSNLKLKSGLAPLRRLGEAGIRLAIGCDNCSCSDTQSMLEGMKLFALLAGVTDPEPGGITAADALLAATLGGAAALGLQGSVGAIEPGMRADLTLFDLDDLAFLPFNSAVRQLVYSANPRAVTDVLVDGRIVIENRRFKSFDIATLRTEIRALTPRFQADFSAVTEANRPAAAALARVHARIAKTDVGLERLADR